MARAEPTANGSAAVELGEMLYLLGTTNGGQQIADGAGRKHCGGKREDVCSLVAASAATPLLFGKARQPVRGRDYNSVPDELV